MNRRLGRVETPPIVEFKARASGVRPAAGLRAFDMTQAVPAYPTFDAIRDGLIEDLRVGKLSLYTDVPGLPELRGRVAKDHPLASGLSAENVLVTAGGNHAAYTALTLLFDPGEKVLLPEPYYFNHDMALTLLGLERAPFAADPGDGFRLDASRMITALDGAGIRGVMLVTPNNPTGACYAPEEILKLLRWTSPRGVEVILDEAYARYDPRHLAAPELTDFIGRGLTLLGSFSKTFSLTGYRVGYLIGSPAQVGEACKIQDTAVICAPHVSQRAALLGLERCRNEVSAKVAEMGSLADFARTRCASLRRFRLVGTGAYFAYLRHPFAGLDATSAALKLYAGSGLLGLPGTVFGASQDEFVRLSLGGVSRNDLGAALEQLERFDRQVSSPQPA